MSSPLLEARALSRIYGGVLALDQVSLALQRGSVCALMGDNGAGKSTLVKILSGVIQPSSGEVLLEGVVLHISDPRSASAPS